jgi:hypothetical protein
MTFRVFMDNMTYPPDYGVDVKVIRMLKEGGEREGGEGGGGKGRKGRKERGEGAGWRGKVIFPPITGCTNMTFPGEHALPPDYGIEVKVIRL